MPVNNDRLDTDFILKMDNIKRLLAITDAADFKLLWSSKTKAFVVANQELTSKNKVITIPPPQKKPSTLKQLLPALRKMAAIQ